MITSLRAKVGYTLGSRRICCLNHFAAELTRIRNAGGYIEYGRVNGSFRCFYSMVQHLTCFLGNLALSRAIGDFEFKKNYSLGPEQQIITADPDILEHQLTDDDEFFVLACDGQFFFASK